MYVYVYTLINILPEAICCCLHTCYLYVVLLEMCYVCMPTCIATIQQGRNYNIFLYGAGGAVAPPLFGGSKKVE